MGPVLLSTTSYKWKYVAEKRCSLHGWLEYRKETGHAVSFGCFCLLFSLWHPWDSAMRTESGSFSSQWTFSGNRLIDTPNLGNSKCSQINKNYTSQVHFNVITVVISDSIFIPLPFPLLRQCSSHFIPVILLIFIICFQDHETDLKWTHFNLKIKEWCQERFTTSCLGQMVQHRILGKCWSLFIAINLISIQVFIKSSKKWKMAIKILIFLFPDWKKTYFLSHQYSSFGHWRWEWASEPEFRNTVMRLPKYTHLRVCSNIYLMHVYIWN